MHAPRSSHSSAAAWLLLVVACLVAVTGFAVAFVATALLSDTIDHGENPLSPVRRVAQFVFALAMIVAAVAAAAAAHEARHGASLRPALVRLGLAAGAFLAWVATFFEWGADAA